MEIKDELTMRIERYVGNYFLYKIVQFQFYIRIILMRLSKIRKKEGERRSFLSEIIPQSYILDINRYTKNDN